MKKLKASLYIFWKSISSPKYYVDVVKTELSFSMKYFVILALLASAATFPRTIEPITNDLKEGLEDVVAALSNSYPEDLVITLKDGELSINQPEPYFFKMPEGEEVVIEDETGEEIENPENLAVIDTNGTLDDLETYDTLFLINNKNILVRSSNKTEVYPLKDYPDGELTQTTVNEFLTEAQPFIEALPYIVLALALVGTVIYYFGFRLAYLVAVSLVLMSVGTLRGMNLRFSKYYQIGIHAMTLPLIVEVLAGQLEIAINYPFWFLFLNVVIGILGIMQIDKN